MTPTQARLAVGAVCGTLFVAWFGTLMGLLRQTSIDNAWTCTSCDVVNVSRTVRPVGAFANATLLTQTEWCVTSNETDTTMCLPLLDWTTASNASVVGVGAAVPCCYSTTDVTGTFSLGAVEVPAARTQQLRTAMFTLLAFWLAPIIALGAILPAFVRLRDREREARRQNAMGDDDYHSVTGVV